MVENKCARKIWLSMRQLTGAEEQLVVEAGYGDQDILRCGPAVCLLAGSSPLCGASQCRPLATRLGPVKSSLLWRLVMAIKRSFISAVLLSVCWLAHLLCVAPISADLLQPVYLLCNTANFTSNSSFARNLNTVIAVLSQRSSSSLFHNATAISNKSSSSDDNAYGFFQCRGDLSLSDCQSCVNAIVVSAVCPSALGRRILFQGCFLRYEAYNFILKVDYAVIISPCVNSSNANAAFRANLASVLNATAEEAPADGGFYTSSRGRGDNTAFALAQCLGYLSRSQCATCLQVSDYNIVCPNGIAGGTYYTTCYYSYSNISFNSSSSTAQAPSVAPPPQNLTAAPEPALSINPSVGGRINSTSQENSKARSKSPAIVVALVGAILLVGLGVVVAFWIMRKRKTSIRYENADGTASLQNFPDNMATKFSLGELRKATNNFHERNKLGAGGFGPVYKGTLQNGREVAIKMLSRESHQGTKQFMNEVKLITTVQHRNLVELIGYCVDDEKRILVYEYLPNRSLDVHLFHGDEERIPLPWRTRWEIIVGIARGLQYLHEDSHVKIVHRDIKPNNILLDNNLNPKIADFGLAKFFASDVTHLTTRVAGTMGYLSPEYVMGGQLTEKVDVYSFGLVALEIVSGRRIMVEEGLEQEKQHLLEQTWKLYVKRQQLQILDPTLRNEQVDAGEVIRIVHVALLCTQTSARARPAMSQVFAMLCGQSEILEVPTKPLLIDSDVTQHSLASGLQSSSSS